MLLTKDNYYSLDADREYISVSQFKAFKQCEARQVAKLKGEWQEPASEALLLGQYVHAWSEGTLEEFKAGHPELFNKKTGELLQKYEVGSKMIDTLSGDDLVSQVREGQKEVILTAGLFGAKWKCMIDIYNPDRRVIVDLKTTREIYKSYWNDAKRTHQNFIEFYDYFLQLAIYAEIDRINRGAEDYFMPHIIAVSKENFPDKAIFNLGTDFIADKLLEVEIGIDRVLKVKSGEVEPERCGKCDYCRATKKITEITHVSDFIV